jgi:hypothetical protein
MSKASELPYEACVVCRKRIKQKGTGRFRKTCSDACKQKLYRKRHGQLGWDVRRAKKRTEARRALPITERGFYGAEPKPVLALGYRRGLFECYVCGTPFLVERIKREWKVAPYCSEACSAKAERDWRKFKTARRRAQKVGGLDPRVEERLEAQKLSPLCAFCEKPFAPNTDEDGKRKTGRPRKYCSDKCCKDAYEHRWKVAHHGKARLHRYRDCAECGVQFDRLHDGMVSGRFCSRACRTRFMTRAYQARQMARITGRHVINGHRIAAKSASKNRGKSAIGNDLSDLSSCAERVRRAVLRLPRVKRVGKKREKVQKEVFVDKGFGWGIA